MVEHALVSNGLDIMPIRIRAVAGLNGRVTETLAHVTTFHPI